MTVGQWIKDAFGRAAGAVLNNAGRHKAGIILALFAGVCWALWSGFWNPMEISYFKPNFVRPGDLGAQNQLEATKILSASVGFWFSNWMWNGLLLLSGWIIDAAVRQISKIKIGD